MPKGTNKDNLPGDGAIVSSADALGDFVASKGSAGTHAVAVVDSIAARCGVPQKAAEGLLRKMLCGLPTREKR